MPSVFSIPSYTGVGDDYDAVQAKAQIKGGKSFAVPGPKKGNGPDATFGKKFLSIHEGDKYVDPGTAEKRYKKEQAKKRITPEGFKMASMPPKPSGLGTHTGCFGKPFPHETDYVVLRKGEAPPKKAPVGRNIVTAPTKSRENLTKFASEYVADFYDADKDEQKKKREEFRAKMKGGPFNATCRRGGTFDETKTAGVSACYKMTKPMAVLKPKKELPPLKGPDAPWRPSGPTENRNVKVEYREDPYDGYDPRVGTVKKTKTEERNGWRPGGTTNSSWYTKSIAFARL